MRRTSLAALAASLVFAVPIGSALAQATRTWVSGVGDDVNPCSRTAPCKTFAGAISKTAAGGEIDTLDPGGYGTVTITKSITIDGGSGIGSILASATNGININAAATDRVILRNLTINGAGTTLGLNGINFLAGNALEVENVRIMNFSQRCISFQPSAKANLLVTKSSLSNCGGGGIFSANAAGGGNNFVQVNNSTIFKSAGAVISGLNSTVQLSNSVVTANGGGGVSATTSSSVLNVQSSSIANNTTFGVQSSNNAVIRLSDTNVTNNAGNGVQSVAGGQILSFQNNYIAGNSPDGAPTGTIGQQ